MIGLVEQRKLQLQIQLVAPAHPSRVDERPIPQFHSGCAEGLNLKNVYHLSEEPEYCNSVYI